MESDLFPVATSSWLLILGVGFFFFCLQIFGRDNLFQKILMVIFLILVLVALYPFLEFSWSMILLNDWIKNLASFLAGFWIAWPWLFTLTMVFTFITVQSQRYFFWNILISFTVIFAIIQLLLIFSNMFST